MSNNSIERIRLVPSADGATNGRTLQDAGNRRALMKDLERRGLRSAALNAFQWWPTLEDTALALCAHLGSDLKDETGAPLAVAALDRALKAFSAATIAGPIDAGVVAFLDSVLELAEQLLRLNVYVEDGEGIRHVWRQFAEPYPTWASRHAAMGEIRSAQTAFVFDQELWAAKRMLATATMVPRDFNLVFRSER
ncbi:MAG: hypothetical protein HYX47_13255 [Burkholderiales bacterium]|nr:hypothetical protein [Burkholderiales bacterium]